MSVLARSGSSCYPVSDEWLKATGSDVPDYCDIDEIRNEATFNPGLPSNALESTPNTAQSAYLTWVLANDPRVFLLQDGSRPTRQDHIAASRFIDNGCRVGNDDGGNDLRGILKGNTIITTNEYVAGIDHPERYRRIYRTNTEVEGFWFVGYNEG